MKNEKAHGKLFGVSEQNLWRKRMDRKRDLRMLLDRFRLNVGNFYHPYI